MHRNVNGIRNPFAYPPWNAARSFSAMFDILAADIVVMQELKIQRKDLRDDMVLIDGWDAYFSLPKHKKGYSGVGIYTRNATCAPLRAEEGLLGVLPSAEGGVPYCELPEDKSIGGYPSTLQVAHMGVDPAMLDAEGRCVVIEFPAFVLFGVYSPANSNGLRDDFRHGFILALDCRIRNLIKAGKRVVLVGDLNVSRDEQDTASAAEDCRKAGITHQEYISTPNRRIFNQLLVGGEVVGERDEGRELGVLWDTTRAFHPDRVGMYTHWEQKINARPGNYGSRIDFVLVAESMRSWVKDANIQEGLLGSDHCPVFTEFHDRIPLSGEEVTMMDVMSPAGIVENGVRTAEWKLQEAPAFSAKKLPEFDKRRSIKSMFGAAKATSAKQETVDNPAIDEEPQQSLATHAEEVDQSTSLIATASQSTASPEKGGSLKRKVPPATKASLKKQKSDASAAKPGPAKGQASLKGFFQAQSRPLNDSSQPGDNASDSPTKTAPAQPKARTTPIASLSAKATTPPPPSPSRNDSPTPSPTTLNTSLQRTEATQKSWSTLFTKPRPPLCEGHAEPCKSMQTKKKGTNQGRSFWMCARPLGPSGEKERGTEWRCPTFIWCSDFRGSGTGGEGKEREGKG